MITRSLSNSITLVLAALGSIVAALLTIEHYTPSVSLPCGIGPSGCMGALHSDYGHLGPIPTALFGLGMYLLIIALCVLRKNQLAALRKGEVARAAAYASAAAPPEATAAEPADAMAAGTAPSPPSPSTNAAFAAPLPYAEVRRLDLGLWLLALAGTGISWWLQYTSFFRLGSFCPYCFSSAILISLIFLLACRDFLLDGRKLTGEQKMLVGVCGFIAVWMILMVVPQIHDQWMKNTIAAPPPTTQTPTGQEFDRATLVKPDMHIQGDPNAPFLVVEFADYMCPNCKQASSFLDEELKDDTMKKKIRLAFRNFPLRMHKWSHQAAEAAEAAGAQGKFWPMHDYLFAHQEEMEGPAFTADRFNDFAQAIGLDMTKFKQDMESGKYKSRVDADLADGQTNGLYSTPTFFIVPPTHKIWRFVGTEQLRTVLNDPKHDVWK